MSTTSFRHVLALLEDDSDGMWGVLERAVELADAERARLTLAKTVDGTAIVTCACALGPMLCAVPLTEEALKQEGADRLAQAAEFVPASIPLTTVLLGWDTPRSLRCLVKQGCHDLLIVGSRYVKHRPMLRRAIRKLGISTLTVSPEPAPKLRLLSREPLQHRPLAQA